MQDFHRSLVPVHFRPHHFLCALGYAGKGYSESFTANMTAIVQQCLRAQGGENTLIMVVGALDDICGACPKRRGIICANQKKVTDLDARHAAALDLRIGEILTWGEALQRIKTHVYPDDLQQICKGCQWLEFGLCQKSVSRLHNEKTPPQSGTALIPI